MSEFYREYGSQPEYSLGSDPIIEKREFLVLSEIGGRYSGYVEEAGNLKYADMWIDKKAVFAYHRGEFIKVSVVTSAYGAEDALRDEAEIEGYKTVVENRSLGDIPIEQSQIFENSLQSVGNRLDLRSLAEGMHYFIVENIDTIPHDRLRRNVDKFITEWRSNKS